MKLILRMAAVVALVAGMGTAALRAVPSAAQKFTPPAVTGAGDIPFPPTSMAVGAVSLLLTLDGSGQVQNTQVLRDYPSLTGVVQTAVQGWQFAPASLGGTHVPANISATVIFNPYNPGGTSFASLALPPPNFTPTSAPGGPGFIPPQILSASFAQYPANSVGFGTVVLDVRVEATGQIGKVRVVRKVASLTTPAINAVQTWAFNPATLHGQPVPADLVIGFVFGRNSGQP